MRMTRQEAARFARGGALAGMVLVIFGMAAAPAGAEVTLQVTSVQGVASLEVDFGTARSVGPEAELGAEGLVRQVRLSISSDSGRPYRVVQRVNGPWSGPDGQEIPLSAVRFSLSETGTGGSNRFPGPAPLSLGEQEIFLSDSSGSPEELVITYAVQMPAGQRAGPYRTTVSYHVEAQ